MRKVAIEADHTWQEPIPQAGAKGLKAARAIGMLTYRNYALFGKQQTDNDKEKTDNFQAAAYINYQGDKLVNRFNAYSYWLLTKAMDSHNIARGRAGQIDDVLHTMHQPALLIGITSDILCPVHEQESIAAGMPNCTLEIIHSEYGHDGFLIEHEQISRKLAAWLAEKAGDTAAVN